MFTLNKSSREAFNALLSRWINTYRGLDEIWDTINKVKPVPLIPGLNVLTREQLAEYFEVCPYNIKQVGTKYIDDRKYNQDAFCKNFTCGSNALARFALSTSSTMYQGARRHLLEFPDFTVVVPSVTRCYSAFSLLRFIVHLTQSEVNAKIIEALIMKAPSKLVESEQISVPVSVNDDSTVHYEWRNLRELVEAYHAKEAEAAKEKEQASVDVVIAEVKELMNSGKSAEFIIARLKTTV